MGITGGRGCTGRGVGGGGVGGRGGSGGTGGSSLGSSGTPGLTGSATTAPVTAASGTGAVAVGPVVISGGVTDHVPVGYVCVTLVGAYFDTSSVPDVAVTAGNGTTSGHVTFDSSSTPVSTVRFGVTKSSTTPGSYQVSNIVATPATGAGSIEVAVTYGTSAQCAGDATSIGTSVAATITGAAVARVYGATADATAAAEVEHQFDASATGCPGRVGSRPIVLATDADFADALSSSYLEGSLKTGELLTPPGFLSAAAADAMRTEGITSVYVVGGPLAVSTAVVDQIESMLAYQCGGQSPLGTGAPVHIKVTRIYGQTEYSTAQWVAEFPNASTVGSVDVAGAFTGTNAAGGSGLYNDTSGNESAAPTGSAPLPTAIVATGRTFQDAESASVLSYDEHFPILLTPPTALSPHVVSAVDALGIRQVVVMGGPLAVSDGVVTSLERMGLGVLRVAGHVASDTAVQLANLEMAPTTGHLGLGWAGSGALVVAPGGSYSDGLAGAVFAARAGPPPPRQRGLQLFRAR